MQGAAMFGVADFFSRVLPFACGIATTLAGGLVFFMQYTNARKKQLDEATMTWRNLAEARAAQQAELIRQLAEKDRLYHRMLERNDFLWERIRVLSDNPEREKRDAEDLAG